MRRLRPLFTLLLLALSLAATASAAGLRTCGTPSLTPEQRAMIEQRLGAAFRGNTAGCAGGNINVAFHVLQSGATGYVTPAQVADQIAVLNADYAPWGYHFQLATLDYTNNATWFNVNSFAVEHALKAALAIDPAHTLNIYTGLLYGGAYLGFAYLPGSFPESSIENSVFLEYRSLPGFGYAPFDLGRTATHEVGHYLGLEHTFEGGCVPPDDGVADTPEEADPNFGCPIGTDSCPLDPGLDPIHNYMDYTDDACYSEFTPGQSSRICAMLSAYRPSLLAGGPTIVRHGSWGGLKIRYR